MNCHDNIPVHIQPLDAGDCAAINAMGGFEVSFTESDKNATRFVEHTMVSRVGASFVEPRRPARVQRSCLKLDSQQDR
jgi:hypothetical protein